MFKESVLKKCMAVAVLLASVLLMASAETCKVPSDQNWNLNDCMSGNPGAHTVTYNGRRCPSLYGEALCCDRCIGDQCGNYMRNNLLEDTERENTICNYTYADLCARLIVNHFHDKCKDKSGGKHGHQKSWDCGSGPTYSQLSSALHNWCYLSDFECYGNDENGDRKPYWEDLAKC